MFEISAVNANPLTALTATSSRASARPVQPDPTDLAVLSGGPAPQGARPGAPTPPVESARGPAEPLLHQQLSGNAFAQGSVAAAGTPSLLTMQPSVDPLEDLLRAAGESASAATRAAARADLQERLGPLQTELELSGPVQGSLNFLLANSLDPMRSPAPEIPRAVEALESALATRPLTDPALRTVVGLLDRPNMAPELVPLLKRWQSQGRLQTEVDLSDSRNFSRLAVEGGRVTALPREFETWQLRSMSDADKRAALASARRALEDCPDYVNLWLSDWVEDPELAPLVEPHRQDILAMPACHEKRGVIQPARSDLVLAMLLNQGRQEDPEVLKRSLGSMLRLAPDENLYLTLREATARFGGSWALEQLSSRSPLLPVTGLRTALHEPLLKGEWIPVRHDVDVLLSLLQLPRTESLMSGPRGEQFRDAASILAEVGRAQPWLLEGWQVHGRDVRDDLLERVLGDRLEDPRQAALARYEVVPDPDCPSYEQALAGLLLEGPAGQARAGRCLHMLEQALARSAPDRPLQGRELRLCGLLATACLSEPDEERLGAAMQGWRRRHGKDPACDEVLYHYARKELNRSLRGLSPQALLAQLPVRRRELAGVLSPEAVNGLALVRLAEAAGSQPERDLPHAARMLAGWTTRATELLPAFENAAREGRLPLLYSSLEKVCGHFGPHEGACMVQLAAPEGRFDPEVLAQVVQASQRLGRMSKIDEPSLLGKCFSLAGPERPLEQVMDLLEETCRALPRTAHGLYVEAGVEVLGEMASWNPPERSLKERVDLFARLSQVDENLFEHEGLRRCLDARAARGHDPEAMASELAGFKELLHGPGHYESLDRAALAHGGRPEDYRELLTLARDVAGLYPGTGSTGRVLEYWRRAEAGEDPRALRQDALRASVGMGGEPEPAAVEERPGGVVMPGVVLRKRSA